MATYLITNELGEKITEPKVIPIQLAEGQRLSILNYLAVGTKGARPNFVEHFDNCQVTVTSTRQEKTDEFLVKIEIIGDNPKQAGQLYEAALRKIFLVSSDHDAPEKKDWLARVLGR